MAELNEIEEVVRTRLRSLRNTLGLSLDELAARTNLSPSTISRVETGKRTISLDILLPLATALQVDLDALLDVRSDDDVVIRPMPNSSGERTTWMLSRPTGSTIAVKMRLEPTRRAARAAGPPGSRLVLRPGGTGALVARRTRDHRRDRRGGRVRHHDAARLRSHRRLGRGHHDLRPRRPTRPRPSRNRWSPDRAKPRYIALLGENAP